MEHQFSINNMVNRNNMKNDSIIARKHTIHHMNANNLKPYTIEIDRALLSAAKGANAKYKMHLEEKRKE